MPATKKRRLEEEPFSASTDEAATKFSSPDTAVSLLPAAADHHTDVLDSSIDLAPGRAGKWAEEEDIKLKDAVQTHGGKDFVAIAALVPGRTKEQCYNRWHHVLDTSTDRAPGHKGSWTAVEDIKLKDAVQMHSGKNWDEIAALVPGRTKQQCGSRWHNVLDPSIDRANRRTGKWAEDEDIKLQDSVQSHGGSDWAAIAALVPGRTRSQCYNRWHVLDATIDQDDRTYG
jgi:hypothetical protein